MAWSRGRRLRVRLPIFIILIGMLVFISNATGVSWDNEPTGQTIASLDGDTAVTFDNPDGLSLPHVGDFAVRERTVSIDVTRPATGETQRISVLIREPVASDGRPSGTDADETADETADGTTDGAVAGTAATLPERLPGVVFMHGAGHGGDPGDSFGDVASAMSSAGFVTAVIDKPIWSTTDIDRDYPASALAYGQVVDYLRGLESVDPAQVGVYATSESTWITPYLLEADPDIAFQILLSPMVFPPRQSLGFFVSQGFTLVGAHDGYQSIVRRVFSVDAGLLGLTNLDLEPLSPSAFAIPTFIAYGSKDVMTAQVEGIEEMLALAHEAGNWDVTIRDYPVSNHVLRLGSNEAVGTPFADDYTDDLTDWALGTLAGLTQTSERLAGSAPYQSIAVPKELGARRVLTVYGLILHGSMIVMMLAAAAIGLAALVRAVRSRLRGTPGQSARRGGRVRRGIDADADADARRAREHAGAPDAPDAPGILGFTHGFGQSLLTLTLTTLATLLLFAAGLGQVIMGVVRLAWGSAPAEDPGLMQWSWPVIQLVCTLVVWAWSGVFARLLEVASARGIIAMPPRRGSIRALVSGREPVLASTRLGRALFWVTAAAMLHVLLVFAFWGLFIY